jgi:hypothetical protein
MPSRLVVRRLDRRGELPPRGQKQPVRRKVRPQQRRSEQYGRLNVREGPRNEALPIQIVMKRIEPARKHGPFDPRWLTVRARKEAEQLEEAPPGAITPAALQAWEGEGGAAGVSSD